MRAECKHPRACIVASHANIASSRVEAVGKLGALERGALHWCIDCGSLRAVVAGEEPCAWVAPASPGVSKLFNELIQRDPRAHVS